uniref:FecR family protein n=1 Tax=Pedobacter schmidteae TaxID=2201271 RepID=UPI000EAF3258|nr:FecR family protein [Pedobacter schmidteae]
MDNQVYTILEKYYRNECSPEEVRVLMAHFNTASEQDLMNYIMKGFEWEKKDFGYNTADKEALDAVYRNLEERIRQAKVDYVMPVERNLPKAGHSMLTIDDTTTTVRRPLWLRYIGVAASIIIILGAGLWFYRPAVILNLLQNPIALTMKNDIAPGHNGATLTLANGRVIDLSDKQTGVIIENDKLIYNDNTHVIPSEARDLLNSTDKRSLPYGRDDDKGGNDQKSEAFIASTAKGQIYQITLPEGTKVWLNADSKLEFPSNFGNSVQRIVKLKGEAYFEVAKVMIKDKGAKSHNKRMPFIVESAGQSLEVLGTHFNVSAYKGEGIRTTLLEGSVRVAYTSRHPEPGLGSGMGKSVRQLRDPGLRRDDGQGGDSGVGPHSATGHAVLDGSLNTKYPVLSTILKPGQQSLVTANSKIKVREVDAAEAVGWKNGMFMFSDESLESVMAKISRWYNVDVVYQDGARTAEIFAGSINRFEQLSKVLEMLQKVGDVKFKVEGRRVTVMK